MNFSIPKLNKKRKSLIIGLFALCIIVAGVFHPASPINPFWETGTLIQSTTVNGESYSASNLPLETMINGFGQSHVRFDMDAEYEGVADLDISITNPAHVKIDPLSGDYVVCPDEEPTFSYSKIYDGIQFFYDHHIYTYWVTVIADPDVFEDGAFSYAEVKNLGGGVGKINLFTRFTLQPWEIGPVSFTEDGEQYNKISDFIGVMSASAIESYAGLVSEGQFIKAGLEWSEDWDDKSTNPVSGYDATATETGALNMYSLDGVSQEDQLEKITQEQFDTIQGVPTAIEVSTYGALQAGYSWPLGGSISTSAVMFQYRVRIDVLASAGYYLISGNQPAIPLDPIVIHSGAVGWFAEIFGFLESDLVNKIMAFVILVLLLYGVIKMLPLLKRTQQGGKM